MKPLIILTGPTAVGKTTLSIELAKAIGGEIISADSMQVYKYMDIGTAKIMPDEMAGIRHYLVDELMPDAPFNVAVFQQMAKSAIEEIYSRGKIPIIVGGTGFYIQALLYDIDFTAEDGDATYRKSLEKLAEEKGAHYLHTLLQDCDAPSAKSIHENNVKRVIRALEFYHIHGTRISDHNEAERQKKSPYQFEYFVLTNERDILYQRIDKRIDVMLEKGLVEEVQKLLDMGYNRELVSMQGLGYKEIVAYLMGECSLEDAVYILKRDTRHFAKRQITWFKREQDVDWIDKSTYKNEADILPAMIEKLKETRIVK